MKHHMNCKQDFEPFRNEEQGILGTYTSHRKLNWNNRKSNLLNYN